MRSKSLPQLAALIVVGACGADTIAAPSGFSSAPGVPGQIVYVRDAFVGGQRLLDSTVIDSASGRWRVSSCGPIGAVGTTCAPTDIRVDSGTVAVAVLPGLFERARRADFMTVPLYVAHSGTVHPDAIHQQIAVVQNGRRQTVMWESDGVIPSPVSALVCMVGQARGTLSYCLD